MGQVQVYDGWCHASGEQRLYDIACEFCNNLNKCVISTRSVAVTQRLTLFLPLSSPNMIIIHLILPRGSNFNDVLLQLFATWADSLLRPGLIKSIHENRIGDDLIRCFPSLQAETFAWILRRPILRLDGV